MLSWLGGSVVPPRQRVVYVETEATPPRDLEASFDVLTVSDRHAAVERVETASVDCVVVSGTGAERTDTVTAVRAAAPSVPIVYTTATPDGRAAAAATRAGATEYFAGTTAQTLVDRVAATIDAGDAVSLVVENLVENAIRHAGPEPTVDVTVSAAEDSVSLSVADDGPGIPESEIAVVTGDSDITQLTHSSGLGLWLVRWIVDGYGGTIRFDEGPLGGSEVTVELPRERPSDDAAATGRTLEAADATGSTERSE